MCIRDRIHDENGEDEDDERVQKVVNYETRYDEDISRKILTENTSAAWKKWTISNFHNFHNFHREACEQSSRSDSRISWWEEVGLLQSKGVEVEGR